MVETCNACGKTIHPKLDGIRADPFDVGYVCYNCYQQIKVEIMTIIREWDERHGLETSVEMEGELTDELCNEFDKIHKERLCQKANR